MGRGRAKAKQAKIARELKYLSPPTDFTALQHELAPEPRPAHEPIDRTTESPDPHGGRRTR